MTANLRESKTQRCEHCGREQAISFERPSTKKCYRWYAYRDQGAEDDCKNFIAKIHDRTVRAAVWKACAKKWRRIVKEVDAECMQAHECELAARAERNALMLAADSMAGAFRTFWLSGEMDMRRASPLAKELLAAQKAYLRVRGITENNLPGQPDGDTKNPWPCICDRPGCSGGCRI